MSRRKAFTLIELLIVVAIIAILAAIAVPNFLEAQVRSKVSRVKSDMRSVATAIEAYYVDFNKYPIASQYVNVAPPLIGRNNFHNRLRGITTPVAYISSVPIDTFRTLETTGFPVNSANGDIPILEYYDRSTAVNLPDSLLSYGLFATTNAWTRFYTLADGNDLLWMILSVGPDRRSDYQQITPIPIPEATALQLGANSAYDPTNGTVSTGDVVRTQFAQRN